MLLAVTPIVLSTRLIRSSLASESASALPAAQQSAKAEIADRYGKLPLSFESNAGQADRAVKFVSRGLGYNLFLTATGAVLTLQKPRPPADKFKPPALTEQGPDNQSPSNQSPGASVLRLKMIGANPRSHAEGKEQLLGKVNYLVGNDPQKWHVNIPTYRKVYYTEIYPKVDLVYYGNQKELEYDFVVAPGGDVQAIRFQFEGADRMTLDDAGDLRLAVEQSEVTLRKPFIYQLTDGGDRREVKGEYVIKGKEVRFKVGAFDERKPLVIDPVLSYSTLLGSGSSEYANGIAVDSLGSAYITGSTSGGFPTTPGAFQTTSSVYGAAFVTKLDPTGTSLVYSTYLAGSNSTAGTSIAINSSGNVFVTGSTKSTDFPTVNPIRGARYNFLKTTDGGNNWAFNNIHSLDAIITVLAVDKNTPTTVYAGTGSNGIYKSTNGGNNWTPLNTGLVNATCRALVIDPSTPSTIYASLTTSESFGSSLYKSTDGGSSWTNLTNGLNGMTVSALAIDPSSPTTIYAGSASLGVFKSTNAGASWTNSSTGINYGGTSAIAVDPVNPQIIYLSAGGGGVFKTTNGGSSWGQMNTGLTSTNVNTLTVDPASNIYAGTSGGGLFKSTNGGGNWTPVNNGISGYIVVRSVALSSSSSATLYLGMGDGRIFKTTDGGNNWIKIYETLTATSFTALAIHPTSSSTVYVGADTTRGTLNDYEAFVAELNANGSGLVYSTYIGGNGDDFAHAIAVDSNGNAIVAGQTASSSFPTLNAHQSNYAGAKDAFVTKINAAGNALLYSTYLGGGIYVGGSNNVVQGNFIGTDASGTATLGNGSYGLQADTNSSQPGNNTIGGTSPAARNIISGNVSSNLIVRSSGNTIQGNYIGTDLTGTVKLSNEAYGIKLEGANNLIGGTTAEARNLISGNGASGIYWNGLSYDSKNRIQGNFIGTDVTGQKKLGNGTGILASGPPIVIGGPEQGAGNLISGNDGPGVQLGCCYGGQIVQGNFIGTDVTGTVALGNLYGVSISSAHNLIGGLVPGAQNLISGNSVGIQISGSARNTVQGNIIGLNAAGNNPLPNSLAGISLSNTLNNIIGGSEAGAGNRISFNGGPGVSVSSSTGNSILGNSIFSNVGLGIDLSPSGVTANDPGDIDTGANNLQNFPLLTSVASNGAGTTIQGTLTSTPNTIFRIDFYSNSACDPSGNGEGARFFDATNVTTDANGDAVINFSSSMALTSGRVITATATDPAGNTSEFSPYDSINAMGSLQFSSATYKVLEDVGNAVITVTRVGGSKGTLSVNYGSADVTATAGPDYTAVSGTLVFADGETSKTFTIPITNDGVTEPDENAQLALAGITDLEAMGSILTATMIIQDTSTPLVLTMNSIDVPEGNSGTTNASVTVSLSAQTARTVTADYNNVAVSATSGVDFLAASGSLTFAPAVTTQTITVSVVGDTIDEINETFRVVLSNPTNANIGSSSTVRVIDDDSLTITSVVPPAGRSLGGQQIKLTGAFGSLSSVRVGGVAAGWFFTNGSGDTGMVTVSTPTHTVGAVQIDLTPSSGAIVSRANAFAYLPTVFTDNTIVVGETTPKSQHIIELRQAVNALRAVAGLGAATWTDAVLSPISTSIKAVHILELRTYLEEAAARLGYAAVAYTDPDLTTGFAIKKIHIEELRQRIRSIAG